MILDFLIRFGILDDIYFNKLSSWYKVCKHSRMSNVKNYE